MIAYKRNLKSIKEIIPKLTYKIVRKSTNNLDLFKELWEKIVGKKISEGARLDKIKNNRLYILVKNSTWMNELTYLKQNIKMEIKKKFFLCQGIQIEDIIYKIDTRKKNVDTFRK